MVHDIREHVFIKEYVSNMENFEEVKELLDFLRKHDRHDLIRDLYALFTKMAVSGYNISGYETDEQYDLAMEQLIEEDGSLTRAIEFMHDIIN